jgi:hypothetical protein
LLPCGKNGPQSPQNNLFNFTVLNSIKSILSFVRKREILHGLTFKPSKYLLGKMEFPEHVMISISSWLSCHWQKPMKPMSLRFRYTLSLGIESLLLKVCYIVGVNTGLKFLKRKANLSHRFL